MATSSTCIDRSSFAKADGRRITAERGIRGDIEVGEGRDVKSACTFAFAIAFAFAFPCTSMPIVGITCPLNKAFGDMSNDAPLPSR